MQVGRRRVESLLDTQLTLARSEKRTEIAQHADVRDGTREEFVQLTLCRTCRHRQRIRSAAVTMDVSRDRKSRMNTRSGAAPIETGGTGAAVRSGGGAPCCRRRLLGC